MPPDVSVADIKKKHSKEIDPHEIDLFIMRATGKSREFLLAHPEYELSAKERRTVTRCVRRRLAHEPVAYILGQREFFGLDFDVTKDTLIPRPETEMLVEEILRYAESEIEDPKSGNRKTAVIDVGTGSGNIIVSIAKQLSHRRSKTADHVFFGLDISSRALKVARSNARKNNVGGSVRFKRSDLLEDLSIDSLGHSIDSLVIAANLPYLSKEIYESSMPDVKDFEPKSALYSPEQGLRHYRKLLEQARDIRKRHPYLRIALFLEISPEQKKLLPKLIESRLPKSEKTFLKDLAGKWRVVRIEVK
jgi:release factor glutamine methyltransferase